MNPAKANRAVGIVAGISLVPCIRGNRADAGHQRAVPCDIEEAGTKGPGAKMRRASFRASAPAPIYVYLRFLRYGKVSVSKAYLTYLTLPYAYLTLRLPCP